jgi:hypothetical protein
MGKVFDYIKTPVEQDAASNGWKQHPFIDFSDPAVPFIFGF